MSFPLIGIVKAFLHSRLQGPQRLFVLIIEGLRPGQVIDDVRILRRSLHPDFETRQRLRLPLVFEQDGRSLEGVKEDAQNLLLGRESLVSVLLLISEPVEQWNI